MKKHLFKVVGYIALVGLSSAAQARDPIYYADVKVDMKSFMKPIREDRIGFEDSNPLQREAAEYLAKFMTALASNDPHDPSPEKKDYRLWSSKFFTVQCSGKGVLTYSTRGAQLAIGLEKIPYLNISIQPDDGSVVIDDSYITSEGTLRVEWKVRARPPKSSSILIDAVRWRNVFYIWQHVTADIRCNPETASGLQMAFNFKGSRFPSHRIWVNGTLIRDIDQEEMEALWKPSSTIPREIN